MREPFLFASVVSLTLAGCTLLTESGSEERTPAPTIAIPSTTGVIPAQPDSLAHPPEGSTPEDQKRPRDENPIAVSHILVAYQGAARSRATRSKDEARQRAREALERLRGGADFGEVALEYSDDSTSRLNRGSLGPPAGTWVEPFTRVAAALAPGGISDPVETSFGFHIIKRDK